ncbi:MAG: hypothetical protein ACYCZX_14970 [Rhodospirillaceae bacterium]
MDHTLTSPATEAVASAKGMSTRGTRIVYPDPAWPVKLGRGFDTITQSLAGDAVADGPTFQAPGTTDKSGQLVVFRMLEIESMSDLKQALDINAAGSFSGLFGVSANARSSFATARHVNRYSVYMFVHVTVTNSTVGLDTYKLTSDGMAAANGGQAATAAFYEKYGDTFVAGISTGGEFIALVEFACESDEESTKLSAAVNASGGMWNVSADFSSTMSNLTKNTTNAISIYRNGGSGTLGNLQELVKAATEFPESVKPTAAPITWSFTTYGYNVALPAGVSGPSLSLALDVIEELGQLYERTEAVKNDLDYVETYPRQFDAREQQALPGLRKDIDALRKKIGNAVDALTEAPLGSLTVADTLSTEIDAIEQRVPARQTGIPPLVVKIFTATGNAAQWPSARVVVDDGYKVISGGAQVNNTGGPGNILTASYPDSPTSWAARSKDHIWADPTTITVWAVAVADPTNLWDVRIETADSERASAPTVTAKLPAGYALTGGGAFADWRTQGSLLTASYPGDSSSWIAASKDHANAEAVVLTAYVIGIKPRSKAAPPPTLIFSKPSAAAPHPYAAASVDAGYTLVGGGARAEWRGPGNMLVASCPDPANPGAWSAESKDHKWPEAVVLTAYAIGIKTA